MAAKKNDGRHLTLEDRLIIQNGIEHELTKAEIARSIKADPTTIAKEIKLHRSLVPGTIKLPVKNCAKYAKCSHRTNCSQNCKDFILFSCKRRDRSPGACNGCEKYKTCHFDKYRYNAYTSQHEYEKNLRESRQGVDMTPEDALVKGDIVKRLLVQGQSPIEIVTNNPELGFCERTLYNYIEDGVFRKSGVTNMDLRRKVSRRQRISKDKKNEFKKRKSHAYLKGRTTADYEAFIKEQNENNSHVSVVEMDTMYNDVSNGPFIQTFKIVDAQIALAIFHKEKTSDEMVKGLDQIEAMLGSDLFESLFTVIRTDRGSEFINPEGLEKRSDGTTRTHVFYCDPMASWQKPLVEGKHVEYRYILPKGKDLYSLGLTSQKQLNIVLSHLNSRTLDSTIGIGSQTPFQYARFFYPDLVDRMYAFGIEEIDGNYVILKPWVLDEKRRNEAFKETKKILSRKAVLKQKKK